MRGHPRSLRAAIVLLSLLAPASVRAQRPAPPPPAVATPPVARDSGYSSREADFVTGQRVYLRSTHTFIGTIRDVEDDHPFPPDRFPRARMKAVLIERRDGPVDWVPVERIGRIYAVKR